MDINDVMNMLGDDTINNLAKSVGGDSSQVKNAIGLALPSMLEALNKNTNTEEGAESLNKALEAHDGSILNNVSGFLSNVDSASSQGQGILGHLFGKKESTVEKAISANSGLDLGATTKIMASMAPLVLGALGKQKREQGLDAQGLGALTSMISGTMKQNNPEKMSLIENLIDQDNDGSIVDDLLGMGGKMLGGFFK